MFLKRSQRDSEGSTYFWLRDFSTRMASGEDERTHIPSVIKTIGRTVWLLEGWNSKASKLPALDDPWCVWAAYHTFAMLQPTFSATMDNKGQDTFNKLISCHPGHVRGLKNAQTAVGEIRFGDALDRLGDEEREMIEADLQGSDASVHKKVERTVAHGLLRWLAEEAQTMREDDSDARGSLAMLSQLAELRMRNGDYKMAAQLLTEEKAIRDDSDPERHQVLVKLAHAHLLQDTPNVREAQQSMEEARYVNGRQLTESDAEFIGMLLLEGAVHEASGEMQDAFNKFGKAREMLRSNDVDDHDAELEAMRRQAFALAKAGTPSDAKEALEAARKEHVSTVGQGNEDTLAVQEALASVLIASRTKRDLIDAVSLLRDAQKARQALHGEKHVKTLEVTEQLGELLVKQGKHDEGTEHLRAAYRARKAAYGPLDVSTINSATKLATAIQGSGGAASKNLLGNIFGEDSPRFGEDSPRGKGGDSSKGREELDALVADIGDGKEDVLRQCLESSEGPTAKRAAALNLARLLRVQGKKDAAATLEKEHKAPAPITLGGPASGSPDNAAESDPGSIDMATSTLPTLIRDIFKKDDRKGELEARISSFVEESVAMFKSESESTRALWMGQQMDELIDTLKMDEFIDTLKLRKVQIKRLREPLESAIRTGLQTAAEALQTVAEGLQTVAEAIPEEFEELDYLVDDVEE